MTQPALSLVPSFQRRTRLVAWMLLAAFAFFLAGCAAHRARMQAQEQMAGADFEAALLTLDAAVREHPDSTELRSTWLRARTEAVARLVTQAGAARALGRYGEAKTALQRAARLDPGNTRVDELTEAIDLESRQAVALGEVRALVDEGQWAAAQAKLSKALALNPRHGELLALQRRVNAAVRDSEPPHGLAEARPISLDFRDTALRTVLDALARHSGVSFIFDKDLRADLRVSVYLRDVKVEDALDLITSTHQLMKKVLDERTVLIYANTPEKLREHQEQVVKAFHLSNGDVKQAAALLRNTLRVREPFVDERSNLLVLRESPEMIRIAERLLALYDTAEPEVTLELEVLEVSASRLTEVGIKFPDTIALTPLAAAGATGLTVSSLRELNSDRVGVSVAGLLLNLRREVGDFQTLANPRVRIRNREKAKVLVGSKIPVVTTTASATGFVSDSVNYLDVGLKLDLEPTIYPDDEVGIRVALEVSSLGTPTKTTSGTLAYQIVTRNANTALRLRDGETQLLAGLVSREERSSANRLPGLGDLPVLGRLFSSQLDNGSRTELVLAITPRVVRNLRLPDAQEGEIWVGTEAQMRLRQPRMAARTTVAPQPAAGLPLAAAAGASAPGSAVAPAAAPAQQPAWPLRWKLPAVVKVGEEFNAELWGNSPLPVRGVNLVLSIKPDEATLLKGDAGAWWTSDETQANVTQAVDTGSGQWQLGVIRRSAQGAQGEGALATLRLKALKDGLLEWPLLKLAPIAAGPDLPVVKDLPALRVEVKR